MSHPSCPGYAVAPFDALVADYPGEDVYPGADFRTEWGPIFHRGRLDGSAKVLLLGQDPAAHEAVSRRILVGEAGQRVQGLLARLGVTRSYVMINTFLYSVYGQGGGTRHEHDPLIAAYRNRWLDALLLGSKVTAVITLGHLAATAYADWETTQPNRARRLHLATLKHPTYPESAARASGSDLAATTSLLLADWNAALPGLDDHVRRDRDGVRGPARLYADHWQDDDLAALPEADLPPGSPPWWRSLDNWATRTGRTAPLKRATITVTVPEADRGWV